MTHGARWIALVVLAAVTVPEASPAEPARADSTIGHELMEAATPAGRLELDVVLRRTLERNPTLGAARAAWNESRARARRAAAWDDPMLDLVAAPGSFGQRDVDAAYRIGITQAVPLFGQRGLEHRMAEADERAAAWDLRTMQLDLVHQARLSYLEYWRVARAITWNRELLRILPELRRVSLAKYSAGLVGQQDPLLVDAELAMLDHQSVILERERRIAAATLNVLMHEPAEAALAPPADTLGLPDTSVVHADLAARAHGLRPELRAADARVAASRAGLALAQRERLPEPRVGVAYDRFWSEPELRASVGLSFDLPIQPGRLGAARAEARARLEASELRGDALRDSIDYQVAAAAARLHESAHDVQIARERMVPLAERTLRAARASYEANRTDFLTVLNSLRDFLRVRLEADESLAMLHTARADLDRALGELPGDGREGQP